MPLNEVCTVNPKIGNEAPPPDTVVSFVPMAAVAERQGGIVQAETRLFRDVAKGYTFFRETDVLFAKITPCMENGKIAIARGLVNGIGFGSTEFHVIRCGSKVLPEWVFAFVSHPAFRAAARESFTGTAGQQRVPADFVKNAAIRIPPLSEQHRLVRLLGEADTLRRLRTRADARMSDFIPALFHEMFGDLNANTKRWPMVDFASVLVRPLRNGLSPASKGNILATVLTLSAITGTRFDPTAKKVAPFVNQPQESDTVNSDDFLVCRGNGNLNLVGAGKFPLSSFLEVTFPDTMIAARVNFDVIKRYFLEQVWVTRFIRRQIESLARTTNGTYKINQQTLGSVKIPLPPVALQREFTVRAVEARALEEKQAQSKARLEALFESMLARAFAGGL